MKNKNFIKINQAIDLKNLEDIKKNLSNLYESGAYPKYFSYPISLQFELTGQCNLACRHCYNRSGDIDRITSMTPDKWRKLAHEIVTDGGVFQCIISGGEPLLLGEDLFDIMDILHEDGTAFVVITNGFLLTSERVKRFSKYRFFWFQISIDGINAKIHDNFRGVAGSWERAIKGAMEVSANGIPLAIAHSVTPENLMHLEEMVELAYKLGASSVILGEVLPSGRAIKNSNIILTIEQKNYLYGMINELQSKYQNKLSIRRAANLKMQMERYKLENNSGGIIRPNGDFRLDCMTPFIIGNVLKNPLKEIWLKKGINAWQSKQVDDFIKSIDIDSQIGQIRNYIDADIML